MPYYIKQGAIGCDGWATIKEDGEVIGCHQSKADAIAQMVAISLAEDMEPGGERALPSEVVEGAFVEWFEIEDIKFVLMLDHHLKTEALGFHKLHQVYLDEIVRYDTL